MSCHHIINFPLTPISSHTPFKKQNKTSHKITENQIRFFLLFTKQQQKKKKTSQIHVSATKGFPTSNIPQPLFNTTDDQTVRLFSSSQNKKKKKHRVYYTKGKYIEDGYGHGEKIKSKLLSLT